MISISLENGTIISIENKQPKTIDPDQKYIFVRLYNPKYITRGVGKDFLQFGQNITADKKWKVISAHAAIALNLKDKFYGLSIVNGDPHLKIESCSGYGKGYITPKEFDLEKSEYTVIGFKCTNDEYDIAKREISNAFYGKTVKFDPVFAGLNMTLYSIGRKIKQTFSSKEDLGDITKNDVTVTKEDVDTVKKICSTFVASVLFASIKSLKTHFEKKENKKKGKYVSPSDIANFPGAKILFSGKFNTYSKDANKFINDHPEFKKFLS